MMMKIAVQKYKASKGGSSRKSMFIVWVVVGTLFYFAFMLGVGHPRLPPYWTQFKQEWSQTPKDVDASENVMVYLPDVLKSPLSIDQEDQWLLKHIRSEYLYPPSEQPYDLSTYVGDALIQKVDFIRKVFKDKNPGFFIECRAQDGEKYLDTLVFEKIYHWKGLLIEADPKKFERLRSKHRRTWALKGCLSIYHYPHAAKYLRGRTSEIGMTSGYSNAQCFPLYSVLLALNTTTVDFFNLSAQGAEFKILKTIPWNKMEIKILSVDFSKAEEDTTSLRTYMGSKGYRLFRRDKGYFMFVSSKIL